MSMLTIGDQMPVFELEDQNGQLFSSASLQGKKAILFFYPRDLTPTCTVEVCNLRDHYTDLKKMGYLLIGVSTDPVAMHKRFAERNKLPYPLLADVDASLSKAFGVWGPKKFMGREIIGIKRTTFLIDESGSISHIFEKVKSKEHAEQIQAALKS